MTNPMTPAVSLLIPIYNVEQYLEKCLRSAQEQTLDNIEIICINDGSTDSSLEIINSFVNSDSRFKLINKVNSGYGASMNKGIMAATGDFIGILESDDYIEPETLEMLYGAAKENKAEVAKANFYFYWSEPQERDEFEPLMHKGMIGAVDPRESTEIFFLKPTIWSAIYRRDFLLAHNITFLETPGASYQDSSFNFKVWASARRVVFLYEAYLHYRQDNENSSVNSPDKVYCVVDEYEEMQRHIDEDMEKRSWLQGILIAMKFDSYIWNYDRLSEQLKLEFLQQITKELKADLEEGRMDLSQLHPWKQADLEILFQSPMTYHQYRSKYSKPGKLTTFKRYLSLGGPKMVLQIALHKLSRGR